MVSPYPYARTTREISLGFHWNRFSRDSVVAGQPLIEIDKLAAVTAEREKLLGAVVSLGAADRTGAIHDWDLTSLLPRESADIF